MIAERRLVGVVHAIRNKWRGYSGWELLHCAAFILLLGIITLLGIQIENSLILLLWANSYAILLRVFATFSHTKTNRNIIIIYAFSNHSFGHKLKRVHTLKQQWSDVLYSCPRNVSGHHGGLIEGPLKPLWPSKHYHIEGFKWSPQLVPHYAERRYYTQRV